MSGQSQRQPHKPLINRPQRAPAPTFPQAPAQQFSQLGQAINGAFNAVGWGQPAPSQSYWGGAGPSYSLQAQWQAQPVWPMQQQPPPPNWPSNGYPAQAYAQPAYPPTHYPQHQHNPIAGPSNHPWPHAQPHSQMPIPRTTEEGYTLSASYLPPPPPPLSTTQPQEPSNKRPRPSEQQASPKLNKEQAARTPKPPKEPPQNQQPQKVKCQLDGCTFEGGKKAVREHEEDRHLIFAPGREPKPWVPNPKLSAGAKIEGTNISLDSPEAIAKWIEERKKRWPTAQKVEENERQRQERIAAGLERPRGGRPRGRGRGRDRGGRDGGAPRSHAYSAQYDDDERDRKRVKVETSADVPSSPKPKPKAEGDNDSDDSSSTSGSDSESDGNSDKEGEEELNVPSDRRTPLETRDNEEDLKNVDDESESDSDNGAPDAQSSKVAVPGLAGPPSPKDYRNEQESIGEPKKQFQVVCKHWRRGRCALEDSCPYLHTLPSHALQPQRQQQKPARKRPAPPSAPYNPFARADPFAQLAERDIAHVVSDVLYAVEFLYRNDWLKGVESRVGQLDEEGGIEELTAVDELQNQDSKTTDHEESSTNSFPAEAKIEIVEMGTVSAKSLDSDEPSTTALPISEENQNVENEVVA